MKEITMIVLTLFSFLHEQKYTVQTTCENNQIKAKYEEEWYDVDLFNAFVKEEADVCSYIKEEAQIEFDSYAKIENPLRVYLFVEGALLQQTLIDDGLATPKIENPNYQYQLEKKQEEAVVAEVKEESKKEGVSYSRYIAYAFLGTYLILCFYLYRRKKKKEEAIQEDTQE